MASRLLLVAILLTGCATPQGLLVTAKPLNVGIQPLGFCLAVPVSGSGTVKYWDPGADCSQRNSSVGESPAVTESAAAERTVRFDVPLHNGVAHVSVRVTENRIASLQTGAEQPVLRLSAVPTSSIDKYLAR